MLKLEYKPYTLDFKFEAGTSRGILKKHSIFLLRISNDGLMPFGYGEAAPLPGLSPESFDSLGVHLATLQQSLRDFEVPQSPEAAMDLAEELVPDIASLRFALETALLDLLNGGKRVVFDNGFVSGKAPIPINGLIWMGKQEEMKERIDQKLSEGFRCLKMKVGAIDWDAELDLIKYIRSKSRDLILRLDANGGFPTNEVFKRLRDLEPLDIHSIEQPIMPRQLEASHLICEKSKIPIALDEELIEIKDVSQMRDMLSFVKPSYIILKPTLLGGFKKTKQWIAEAERIGVDWWITSALESNIGLNAICQFAVSVEAQSFQGLGTGQLYTNNIKSPLVIKQGSIAYDTSLNWDIPF